LLVVSCDSAGGIGSKPFDRVRADARLIGKMTARVALMELLAIGANPIAITGTFSVEPEPTANLVLDGVREELRNARLRGVKILCSSEKNVKVNQTGIGVTAIGLLLSSSGVKIGRCREGDEVLAVGEPFVGQEVVAAEKRRMVADSLDVIRLRRNPLVHELIPVGSKGILHEARVVARDSKLSFEPVDSRDFDLRKSAGPATVLLSAVRGGSFANVQKSEVSKPIRKIGTLRKS
jgi:selenophosphate synthetase-related protein